MENRRQHHSLDVVHGRQIQLAVTSATAASEAYVTSPIQITCPRDVARKDRSVGQRVQRSARVRTPPPSPWALLPPSEDKEEPWDSVRAQVDEASALLQELRLINALDSAVQSGAPAADLAGLLAQIKATKDYFPFEISENKRGDAITLTRALKGEQIKVVVSMPSIDADDEEKKNEPSLSSSNEDAKEDEEGETYTSRSTMHLEVTISKGDGSNLQFSCFSDPDKVEIYTMYMAQPTTKEDGDGDHDMATYDGFDGLDENLQKTFHEYLELRGITPKMMNLLRGYLSGQLQRKHTLWLNNLQDFVSKNELTTEAA